MEICASVPVAVPMPFVLGQLHIDSTKRLHRLEMDAQRLAFLGCHINKCKTFRLMHNKR